MADSCVILLCGNNPSGGFIATKGQDNDEKPSSSASLIPSEKLEWGIKACHPILGDVVEV
jgi:hypothetical protein